MATLDATQARLLENAPDNPNSPKKAETVAARPGLGFSKSTTGPPKPSLRETMLAQKKAVLANKNIPARPGSHVQFLSYAYGLDVVQCIRIVHSFRNRTSETPTRVDNCCPWWSFCRSNAAYQIPSCPSTGTYRKTRNSRPLLSKTSRSRSY